MLAVRSLAEEQMDSTALDPARYARVLADLERVNTVTLARRPTLGFVRALLAGHKTARILDVGFGQGDMLRAVARTCARMGVDAQLTGIDLNPRSAPLAEAATPAALPIRYLTGDYQSLAGQDWDLILSSLVAHHMTAEQLDSFLRFMTAEARLGWYVNDLHRHGFAWMGYPLLARLMGVDGIVRQDGQLSIARSYRPGEWPAILARAGVAGAHIERVFPFRLCVSWHR